MNSSFTEDESIDSGTEDYDTDELKLQDIAAIVLGDVKQVCINEVTSDNENDSFEQRYKKCNANKPLNIDPYSIKRENLDAPENNQELANGNDEEIEEPCNVDNLNESGDVTPSSRPPILEPSTNFVDQCSSPNTSPSRLTPYDENDSLRSSSLSPIRREKTPEINESLSPVRREKTPENFEADESLSPVRREKTPEEDESLSPVRREKAPEKYESLSPVRRENPPEEDESLSPVRREKTPEKYESLSPVRREKPPEEDESLSPVRREKIPEEDESLSPVRRERTPEVDESLSPARREKSPEIDESLYLTRRVNSPKVDESLSPTIREKSPEIDESLSPSRGEKTLENTVINESSANSTDPSIETECLLKVLDEVRASPRSCESPSKQHIQNSTPPCVYESIEQIKPLDSDNYNSFCDKPNVEKLSGCDKPYDGDCTPRDGSQTPILYSPSSHDYNTDLKDVTFDSTADILKPEENETREKPNENGTFESAEELWKEDEDGISNSFTTIDIPLPPSENRSGEKDSKRWNFSRWSTSKRDRDRSSPRRDRSKSKRDRDQRDHSESRKDRDRQDRSESRKDRDRRDRSESRKDRDRRDRSESRKDRDRRDRSESRKDRSRRDRSESKKDRDRRDRSESKRDRDRRDRSESKRDRVRRDRSESRKDRDRRDRSESRRDRDRRGRSESRRDRDKRDRRNSSRDGRSSKRSHHRDSSDEKHSKDSRSRKSDSDRSSKKRRSSGRRSSGHRSPDDHKRDDHRRSESSRWSRKERSRDRSPPHDDRRTSDRHSRDKSHHRDRYSSADKADKNHSRRHDYSRSKRDYKKSRKHSYSSDASSDDSRAHKTVDSDRRANDFDRKPNNFNRRTKNFDRRSKGFDRRSKDFGRRNNNSDRKSPDFDRSFNESGVQKPPEPERPWNDDRFELNKQVEMPDPFEDENWDEDAQPGSYYCNKRPPEPKSPPPPEPDYPPPEPNYPPPPEPSYSPEDRPPSPAEEPITTPPRFEPILENEYRTERSVSKDAERMICDCTLTKEEIHRGEKGCGEDCLNRLLLIECCSRCCLGERCSNKRFQRREYPNCEIFKTKKKGHGLRTLEDIPCGTFIMEYVGEVLDSFEFEQRAMEYARSKKPHFYFMSLKSDHIIDATVKGNISRFINHSCEPNAETQKWTVQGELRIGFFSLRDIKAGEEITFDYQLQRYGKQAQRCYCDAPTCNGWIGDDPDKYVNDRHGFKDWETALDEISQVGLMNRHQTLNLNRLMVHAKELPVRMQILQLIEEGNPPCRRLFVDYHGLPIIWSWMVDCTPEQDELRIQILKTLASLPITNKTILVDSKVLSVVEQWAFMFEQKVHSSEALSAQSVLESVEDIASANETPVSELAQKLMNDWSSLREAYRIPRKERIQQMKKHEQEADQTMPKHKPKRLPFYAEQMRDRYRRNRHSRDKDFEKIYFDRMKDYDGSTPDQKKRREGGRNFENRKHRRGDTSDESSNNSKVSKTEHRLMFEMKMKQKEEEQQQNWLKLFYSQQSQMAGMMLPAAFMAHLPPPNYPPPTPIDPKQQQQPQQQPPSSTRTHPYYPIAPPVVYPTVPTPHMQLPPSAPTATSALPPSTQYYRTPIVAAPYQTPTAVPYPRPVIADQQQQPQAQPAPGHVKPEEQFVYDFQAIRNQMQQIAPIDEAMLRDTLRMAELADRRESQSYPASSGGQPANDTDSAEQVKLPPNWKTARDNEGRVYYYHTKTRVSQWYPPTEANRSDEDTSDGRSTGEEDEDVEFKKRRRKSSRGGEKDESDMDAEIKENLAAMSSEFQDSDYEDYSPAFKNSEEAENSDKQKLSPSQLANDSKPEKVPLTTEHIISPREPVEKEERVNNKKRMHELKEKLRRHKKARLTNGNSSGSKGNSNGHVNSNSSKLVSAPADTSSITERKKKDAFRTSMANFVVSCLNPYFRSTCPQARITNDKDFKHLARKLTHFVMLKELKHCQSVTDLTCNSSVKHKAKEYIRKYMSKFGEIYVRPPDDANY